MSSPSCPPASTVRVVRDSPQPPALSSPAVADHRIATAGPYRSVHRDFPLLLPSACPLPRGKARSGRADAVQRAPCPGAASRLPAASSSNLPPAVMHAVLLPPHSNTAIPTPSIEGMKKERGTVPSDEIAVGPSGFSVLAGTGIIVLKSPPYRGFPAAVIVRPQLPYHPA